MFEPKPQHLTKEAFDKSYEGVPPWEIGRPQPELLRLLDDGIVNGLVLDVGCGTGELSLEMARRGLKVVGVDASPRAIGRARQKALEQHLPVLFEVVDALTMKFDRRFDTAVDCGLFHVFSDDERTSYVRSLTNVVRPQGRLVLICFSELEQREGGPRRVTQAELRDSFDPDWSFEVLRAARFDSLIHEGGAAAWLALLRRNG